MSSHLNPELIPFLGALVLIGATAIFLCRQFQHLWKEGDLKALGYIALFFVVGTALWCTYTYELGRAQDAAMQRFQVSEVTPACTIDNSILSDDQTQANANQCKMKKEQKKLVLAADHEWVVTLKEDIVSTVCFFASNFPGASWIIADSESYKKRKLESNSSMVLLVIEEAFETVVRPFHMFRFLVGVIYMMALSYTISMGPQWAFKTITTTIPQAISMLFTSNWMSRILCCGGRDRKKEHPVPEGCGLLMQQLQEAETREDYAVACTLFLRTYTKLRGPVPLSREQENEKPVHHISTASKLTFHCRT